MTDGRREKTTLSIVLLILVITVVASLKIVMDINKNKKILKDINEYDASKEIKLALDRLLKDDSKADIISKVNAQEKVVSLNFQGLSDSETNQQILDLIIKYDVKMDFFVPGILAAENSDFIKDLYSKGHRLGSNTLSQMKAMQKYSKEELIDDFVRTNIIFRAITKKEPTTLMCNSTIYTDDLLRAAYASGNKKIIETTEFLNYQSFRDYNQVLAYVNNTEKGSIITIKMDGTLEKNEYKASKEDEKPSLDKKPGIYKEESITEELSPEKRLIFIVDWLLKALKETNHKIVFAEELEHYGVSDTTKKDSEDNISIKVEKNSIEREIKNNTIHSQAIKDTNKLEQEYTGREKLDELRIKNKGKKAKEYNTIYTTEKALTYTFYGIYNNKALKRVLINLDVLKANGTFYVTRRDVMDNPDTIKEIAERGHEIGISLLESQDNDFYSILDTILFIQKNVYALTGQVPRLVRYPYYIKLDSEKLEAISSGSCDVVWHDVAVASSKIGKSANLNAILNNAFGQGNISARRGYIIYYRMDYYENSHTIPEAMLKIARDRIDTIAYNDGIINNGSNYAIKSLGSIIKGDKIYNYPLKEQDLLSVIKNAIYPGHLSKYGEPNKFDFMKSRYTGNPHVNNANTLPGFTDKELEQIDKTGRFTDDKVLFLTIDDWASDKSINQLLYILNKHDIKASFFIRTNYMQNNPNILRAIAEEGHDVGSHTDNHLPFALGEKNLDENDISSIYRSLNKTEVTERKNDLLISYNKLKNVIGDISIDGRPSLTTIFRLPTLAMSKIGMESILDMGFSYIVSGDFSTHDYEETDPEVLADKIIGGRTTDGGELITIQNGSILVMHMSDFKENPLNSSNVTASALDIVIPRLKQKGYRFARLSDYLK